MVKLKIDNFDVEVKEGTSILDAARSVQIDIPTLCKHPDVDPSAGCGMCIVKNNGRIMRSCCTPVSEGMEIVTNDADLRDIRKTVLELILSNHPNQCLTCMRSGQCELQDMAVQMGVDRDEIKKIVAPSEKDETTKAIVLDPAKCIVCGRCVDICQNVQNVWALSYLHRGLATKITGANDAKLADSPCIKCGQCAAHCPTGAIVEYDETAQVWDMLKDKELVTVVQIAPAVRIALGEEFGYDFGKNLTGKIYAALRTAYFYLTGQELGTLNFKEIEGLEAVKVAEADINGTKVRIAVVNGVGNVERVVEAIKTAAANGEEMPYHFVEVMACPGGCIAGGGQPKVMMHGLPKPWGINDDIRKKRSKGLNDEDEEAKNRLSHHNESIKKLYETFLGKPGEGKAHELLHTKYRQRDLYK